MTDETEKDIEKKIDDSTDADDSSSKKNNNKQTVNLALSIKQIALVSGFFGVLIGVILGFAFASIAFSSVEAPTPGGDGEEIEPEEITFTPELPYDVEIGVATQNAQYQQGTVELEGRPYMGSSDADVVFVSYEDFFCPFCGAFNNQQVGQQIDGNTAFPQIMENHIETGNVQFFYKQFPVVGGEQPSMISECVLEHAGPEAFYTFHYNHFNNFHQLRELSQSDNDEYVSILTDWAEELGADRQEFSQCVLDNEMASTVQNHANEAQRFEATGTPAALINGELMTGAQPYQAYDEIIRSY